MTGFTVIAGIDMAGVFAGGSTAVMAASAATQYLSMVNLGFRCPVSIRMTAFTAVGGIDMAAVLSSGCATVVTGSTVCCGACVVKDRFSPAKLRVMAILTGISTRNMIS